MKIKRGKYTLFSDRFSYWLKEDKVVQKGENKGRVYDTTVCGYHPHIDSLLKAFVEAKMKESDATSMKKLLEDVKKIKDDLLALIDGRTDI